jgi:protein-disulfide isomerase
MIPRNSEKAMPSNLAKQLSGTKSRSTWIMPILLAGLASAALAPLGLAQDQKPPQAKPPIAVLDGQTLDESLLPQGEQAQLNRMMQQVYGVQLRALHEVLDQKLVDAEAKKKGVSIEDLVKSEVLSKIPDPSDDDVSAYYQAHQNQFNQPLEQAKEKIRQQIKESEIQHARIVYVQGLWQKAVNDGRLTVLLSHPKLEIPVDPTRLRGDPKAPVTIIEFGDFSCADCRKAESTLSELLAKYPGQVKLAYRDLPLREIHPQAQLAAEASRCAGEQGKYWEFHDLLFAHQEQQSRQALLDDARTLKLDVPQFDACLDSGRFKPQIDQDADLGTRVGIFAAPAFFVNGTFINGAQPAAAFEKIIDTELAGPSERPNRH